MDAFDVLNAWAADRPNLREQRVMAWRRAWSRGEGEQPSYVLACGKRAWRLPLMQKAKAKKSKVANKYGWKVPVVQWDGVVGKEVRIPYRCGSWRCASCRDYSRRKDFVRIEEGLQRHKARDVVFIVLTMDPSKYRDVWDAFDAMRPRLRSFMKYLKRNWGLAGYVATVEVHKSGWPHLNVIAVAGPLAKALREPKKGAKQNWAVLDAVKGAAQRCGWGRLSAEIPKSVGAVTSYCVKVAGDTERRVEAMSTTGEVTKSTQLPLNAPPHFRRLRSSPGFLPPDVGSGMWTGKLEFFPLPDDEMKKWDEEQAAKKKAKEVSGSLRAKRTRSRVRAYMARLLWWNATQLDLWSWAANRPPEQLNLLAA